MHCPHCGPAGGGARRDHGDCPRLLQRPVLRAPEMTPTDEELDLARATARALAAIVQRAARAPEGHTPRCGLQALAHGHLSRMTAQGRAAALAQAGRLQRPPCSDGADPADGDGRALDPALRQRWRQMASRRLQAQRAEVDTAIAAVLRQVQDRVLEAPRTTVAVRPAGEIVVPPTRYMCVDSPPPLRAHWRSTEPDAARAYWELRGPAFLADPGPLLARGYSPGQVHDDAVDGFFDLNLADFLPPQRPSITLRYQLRVLPLAAADDALVLTWHRGRALQPVGANEPEPPPGVGRWSPPARIDYGLACRQPPTQFHFETVDWFRRARLRVQAFRVDADQPGPGDEEYHLRAFIVGHHGAGTVALGSFGTFLAVAEGDRSWHPLGWASAHLALHAPRGTMWPVLLLAVLSVVEEDDGGSLDEWREMMADLAREAIEGDLADEIDRALRDMRGRIAKATEALQKSVADDTAAFIGEMISAAGSGMLGAFVAFAVALIKTFVQAGAADDPYTFGVLSVVLGTSEVARLADRSGWSVAGLTAGHGGSGGVAGGRYTSGEIRVQMTGLPGRDTSALNGLVSVKLTLECDDMATDTY